MLPIILLIALSPFTVAGALYTRDLIAATLNRIRPAQGKHQPPAGRPASTPPERTGWQRAWLADLRGRLSELAAGHADNGKLLADELRQASYVLDEDLGRLTLVVLDLSTELARIHDDPETAIGAIHGALAVAACHLMASADLEPATAL